MGEQMKPHGCGNGRSGEFLGMARGGVMVSAEHRIHNALHRQAETTRRRMALEGEPVADMSQICYPN